MNFTLLPDYTVSYPKTYAFSEASEIREESTWDVQNQAANCELMSQRRNLAQPLRYIYYTVSLSVPPLLSPVCVYHSFVRYDPNFACQQLRT